ncbi:arsenic metallochaperone ArsD family protein [Enterobacter hormaechei]
MKTLTVFDPAMCCSTGVCGSDGDQVWSILLQMCNSLGSWSRRWMLKPS